MKKLLVSLTMVVMGALMCLPSVDAQGRRGGNPSSSSAASGQRPGRGGASSAPQSGSGQSRPGSSSPSTRPGSSVSTPSVRPTTPAPAKKPENGVRPGASGRPSGPAVTPSRPGSSVPSYRPAPATPKPSRPGSTYVPTPRPPRPVYVAPPSRPGRPIYTTPWVRPLPPSTWRPTRRYTVVPNILGMTLGLTLNSALDYLYNSGYSVDGYGSQEVYLRNVNELGYQWDEATLYFSNNGLVRSQFYDSTPYYTTQRYESVYSRLTASYGAPVSQSNANGTISATWFGYQGDYVTLLYSRMNSSGGYRYFTILTYGN